MDWDLVRVQLSRVSESMMFRKDLRVYGKVCGSDTRTIVVGIPEFITGAGSIYDLKFPDGTIVTCHLLELGTITFAK